jgi:hypothetical protein
MLFFLSNPIPILRNFNNITAHKNEGSEVNALFQWLPLPLHVASGAPGYRVSGYD